MGGRATMTNAMRCFIGVDAGGSQTRAVVVDAQGRELGRGVGGGANYTAMGSRHTVATLRTVVAQAAAAASRELPLHAAWLGLAGVDRPSDYAELLPELRGLSENIRLTNDAELVLAALDDAVGVAVIAGTGSIAVGCAANGTTARAGGWGHLIGDEGSGYDIGRQGLQAAAQAADGRGPHTVLLERLLRQWQLEKPQEIIGRIYPGTDKAPIARLAPLVCAVAREGDPVARGIVRQAATDLARAILTVANVLAFPAEEMPLALAGGILVHDAWMRTLVLRRVRRTRRLGSVVIVKDAALCAARAAARMDGTWAVDGEKHIWIST